MTFKLHASQTLETFQERRHLTFLWFLSVQTCFQWRKLGQHLLPPNWDYPVKLRSAWYNLYSCKLLEREYVTLSHLPAGSLPRETRELLLSHASCCVQRQEGTRWGSNNICASFMSSHTLEVSSLSDWTAHEGRAGVCYRRIDLCLISLLYFERASPTMCLGRDGTHQPLTCQDYNLCSCR